MSSRAAEIQLFMPSGMLVGTVTVDLILGKMPLIVQYAGAFYALVDGRYVAASLAVAVATFV